jgi:hypothetical protein
MFQGQNLKCNLLEEEQEKRVYHHFMILCILQRRNFIIQWLVFFLKPELLLAQNCSEQNEKFL